MKRVIVSAALAAMVLSGCVSTRSQHGYVVELGETGLNAIPGVDSRESIIARFGEPSVRPPLHDDVWYYITQNNNSRAFFRSQVYDRRVVGFRFDGEGMVEGVDTLSLDDGTNIDIVARTTRTRGKELSFFEQLLGGVGQVGIPQQGPGGPGQQGPQ